MEVNLQFHGLTAQFSVKEHPVDIRYVAGWVPDTTWIFFLGGGIKRWK
jgi:hypothetical protein